MGQRRANETDRRTLYRLLDLADATDGAAKRASGRSRDGRHSAWLRRETDNLLDESLPAQVAELLATHGVPPDLLELPVTELVAEGVETEEARQALAGYGCHLAQGYHLSPARHRRGLDAWRAGRDSPAITPLALAVKA